jgi:uncharacterized protein (TIGR02466 family)
LVNKEDAHPLTLAERESKARFYYEAAGKFDAKKGQGNLGWIHLLASYDYHPTGYDVLYDLVTNYIESNYTELAFDELFRVLRKYPGHEEAVSLLSKLSKEYPQQWDLYQRGRGYVKIVVPKMNLSLMFTTAVGRWWLGHTYNQIDDLNQKFYDATVEAFEKFRDNVFKEADEVRKVRPTHSTLNHMFFQWQMKILRETGDYWEGYTKLSHFLTLKSMFYEAAVQLLMAHGYEEEVARKKASHNTVFWVSVHTTGSVHEPHMTEDSLIGGVYYVTVPKGSGKLGLFDPRGKSPVLGTIPQTAGEPVPPFHRTVAIQPEPGLLILFPGWLIHTVYPSDLLPNSPYRVSISVNLKGEWQDTTTGSMLYENLQYKTS